MSESTAVEDRGADLRVLVELQQLDLRRNELQRIVDELPDAQAALQETLDTERAALDEAREGVEDSAQQVRRLEGEVSDLNEKQSRYKMQLMEVKTNDAYQAMLQEIEFVKRAIATKEDEILQQMLEIDELKERTASVEETFRVREKEIADRRTKLEKRAAEAAAELEEIGPRRAEIEAQVPKDLLGQYNRISAARSGLVLVPVEGENCQACHVRLRPQVIAMVRAGRGIHPCENCSRILYSPDA